MADSGRGGRGGRARGGPSGRGGQGDRGGGDGGGRGGRGRGGFQDRGGAEGGRGGSRGRGGFQDRGGAEGGRGGSRGRGGFQDRGGGDGGGRGGSRGRGGFQDRGGGEGGRGGGRGRGGFRGRGGSRIPFEGEAHTFYGQSAAIPPPDKEVTQLEDEIILAHQSKDKALVQRMKGMKITEASSVALMPRRPAYGTKGKPVTLWANYFRLTAIPKVVYRYNLEPYRVSEEGTSPPEKDPKGKRKEKTQDSGASGGLADSIPSRKLKTILQIALAEIQRLEPKSILATEFKSQLISLHKLKLERNPLVIKFVVENSTREQVYHVKVVGETEAPLDLMVDYLKTQIDTGDPDDEHFPRFASSMDALGVILGYVPRQMEQVTAVGKGRFFPWGNGAAFHQLGNSNPLTAIRGYFQSVRLGTGRPLLNVNVTHGVFKTSVRVDELCRWFGVNVFGGAPAAVVNQRQNLRTLSKFLARTRVQVEFRDSKGKDIVGTKAMLSLADKHDLSRSLVGGDINFADGFQFGGPNEVILNMKPLEGQKTVMGNKPPGKYTVSQYWQWKYGKVPDKTMPLVNVGTNTRPIYYPAERCTIVPGQAVRSKLTGDETTQMLDFACRSPFANAISLTADSASALGFDDQILKDFGIAVDKKLLTVAGRELISPQVLYSNKTMAPKDASWNMAGVKVVRAGPKITSWNWVRLIEGNYDPKIPTTQVGASVQKFVEFLNNNMGIAIDQKAPNTPHEIRVQRHSYTENIKRAFQAIADDVKKTRGTTRRFFLLVVLPRQDTALYGAIKTLADIDFGFNTVCVVERTFMKDSPQTFANVALKWNLKNGGVNHVVKDPLDIISSGKTMVVGYDVTHPTNMSNDKNTAPSLVGLVTSIDRDMGQWPAIAWEQTSRQEMLDRKLVEHFESRLVLWRNHQKGALPENIVIYRDGVSEGQFTQVLAQELPMIREACSHVYPPSQRPLISILVSVKRHQTRFYPTSDQNMGNSRNIKSGTIVDRGVTQARYWDFFLTAHTALKGTARPAHYTVLLDEIFREKYGVGTKAADNLEKLTHDLCYLFGRATKAVSICPPAYYADIVCDRARVHRPELFDVSDTASVASSGVTTTTKSVHENLRDTMYYI